MKKAVVFLVLVAAMVPLAGCPELIGPTLNTLVVHNLVYGDFNESEIAFLTVVRVPDECSTQKPQGINLLPENIQLEGTFTVKDLPDGRYYCKAVLNVFVGLDPEYPDWDGWDVDEEASGYVTLGGGGTADWYINEAW